MLDAERWKVARLDPLGLRLLAVPALCGRTGGDIDRFVLGLRAPLGPSSLAVLITCRGEKVALHGLDVLEDGSSAKWHRPKGEGGGASDRASML